MPSSVAVRAPVDRRAFAAGLSFVTVGVLALGIASRVDPPAPARPHPVIRAVPPRPVALSLRFRRGETLAQAVRRAGVGAGEARAAERNAAEAAGGPLRLGAGRPLDLDLLPSPGHQAARLLRLALRTGPASTIVMSRAPDGFHAREIDEPVRDETAVTLGQVRGSLYQSALRAGVDGQLTAEVVKLFSKTLDFARDFHSGDDFRLVFDRRATAAGRTLSVGALRYAEIDAKGRATRFYRFDVDGKPQFFDAAGKTAGSFLLRTPVDGARVTSGFGLRLHPILAYTRMHPGIDFGAPVGTPVYAAGEGVVAEAKWAGGYGHWLKLVHPGGWATGYGHLSAYARGLRVGQRVAQGQVVAYVGSTGLSTGPHLHYEVMRGDRKIDPGGAAVPRGLALEGPRLIAFNAEKARIDGLLTRAAAAAAGRVQVAALGGQAGAALAP